MTPGSCWVNIPDPMFLSMQTINKLKELGYEVLPQPHILLIYPIQTTTVFRGCTTLCEENCLQIIQKLKMGFPTVLTPESNFFKSRIENFVSRWQ